MIQTVVTTASPASASFVYAQLEEVVKQLSLAYMRGPVDLPDFFAEKKCKWDVMPRDARGISEACIIIYMERCPQYGLVIPPLHRTLNEYSVAAVREYYDSRSRGETEIITRFTIMLHAQTLRVDGMWTVSRRGTLNGTGDEWDSGR